MRGFGISGMGGGFEKGSLGVLWFRGFVVGFLYNKRFRTDILDLGKLSCA